MSTQKGNASRTRTQKHKNIRVFKNDKYDTSHITKKINNLEFYGICNRCKDIIDWKVKYKKYKNLTTLKKCVKCLEKKVKYAYYIVCTDCCTTHKICSKCSKPCEELEFGESEVEKRRKEDQFQLELKQLSERQRRKFLRLLEKGFFTKENLINDSDQFKKESDSDIVFSDDEIGDEEDFDDEDEDEEESDEDCSSDTEVEAKRVIKKKLNKKNQDVNNNLEKAAVDEDDEEEDSEGDDDDDDDEYETLDEDDEDEEEEEKPKKK